MTFKNTDHFTSPHPPSGGDSQESGIVQPGSPHSTRTTKGSRLNTATTIAAHPTTLGKVAVCTRLRIGRKFKRRWGREWGNVFTYENACKIYSSERSLSLHHYTAWTEPFMHRGLSQVQATLGM